MTKEDESWKFHSSLGYFVVIIGVGIPVWWATTTVYRASLPYDAIAALSEPKLTQSVLFISQDAQSDHKLGPHLQKSLASRLIEVNFRSRVRSEQEENAFIAFKKLTELDDRLLELHGSTKSVIVFEAPPLLFQDNPGKVLAIGKGNILLYKSGADPQDLSKAVQSVLGLEKLDNIATAIDSPTHDKNPSWTLRRPIAAPAFDVLFSLMIPEPEFFKPTWDIEKAVDNYFQPMLTQPLKEISHVSIKSQILYLSSLNLKPQKGPEHYYVTKKDLGLAINVGAQLSSHVSSRPILNFLTYIPMSKHSPLTITQAEHTNAFLVPRWGGVLVLNSNQTNLDMQVIMQTFATHFKQLIGLDHYDKDKVFKVANSPIISQLEKDFLLKMNLVENLAVAQLTMKSLSHLLTKISNIVINEQVSKLVYTAVQDYEESLVKAKSGHLQEAFQKSQTSFESSEKAFFDDTLLALLYFPEDQKYAIYIPLFLPVFISFWGSFSYLFKDYLPSNKDLALYVLFPVGVYYCYQQGYFHELLEEYFPQQ